MERHVQVDTQITSHLLAALNLPPLREVAPFPGDSDQQPRNRPLPLEPSASQDAYSASQYSQSRRDPVPAPRPQTPNRSECASDAGQSERVRVPSQEDSREVVGQPSHSVLAQSHDDHGQTLGIQDNLTINAPRAYPAILPSGEPVTPVQQPQPQPQVQTKSRGVSRTQNSANKGSSNRRVRRKWTEEETNDLIRGCHIHGVGNWKKVLDDPRFHFNGRSSVDLKDRFRTCFPREYRKSSSAAAESEGSESEIKQPGTAGSESVLATPSKSTSNGKGSKGRVPTKTELHHAEVLEKLGIGGSFPKVQRRERREFTAEEDARLLQGFQIYGASWSRIQSDPALQLSHRRGTDLRDRFRNAFPDQYESAGFKARPRQRPKPTLSQEAPSIQSGNMGGVNADQDPENANVDPNLENPPKNDSTSALVNSLLGGNISPSWAAQDGPAVTSDHSPAPGSLALDPALNAGFEGSTLEQITEDFLAVAQGSTKDGQQTDGNQNQSDVVRWEDMATHPIFELEPSMTSTGNQSEPKKSVSSMVSRKRNAESNDAEDRGPPKKTRTFSKVD